MIRPDWLYTYPATMPYFGQWPSQPLVQTVAIDMPMPSWIGWMIVLQAGMFGAFLVWMFGTEILGWIIWWRDRRAQQAASAATSAEG